MSSVFEIQQDTLKLFQGKPTKHLSQNEINNLNIYKGLVINSMEGLLAKIFSEIYQFHKEEWRKITQDYLELFPSKSPIYNQLCKDFPQYLQTKSFKDTYAKNNYFHEVALYKWLDLKVYNSKAKAPLKNGFTQNYKLYESNFNIPLIINYLNSKQEVNKDDDMEINKNYIFVYRVDSETKTLVLNSISKLFIEKLEANLSLEAIKSDFIKEYSSQSKDIVSDIEALINYLKNMRILLI